MPRKEYGHTHEVNVARQQLYRAKFRALPHLVVRLPDLGDEVELAQGVTANSGLAHERVAGGLGHAQHIGKGPGTGTDELNGELVGVAWRILYAPSNLLRDERLARLWKQQTKTFEERSRSPVQELLR